MSTISPLSSAPHPLSESDAAPKSGAFAEAFRKVQMASRLATTQSIQAIDKVAPTAPPAVPRVLSGMMGQLEKEGARVDRLIAAATAGRSVSNVELLALQASMYRYNQEIELLSKVVQQAVDGLKQLLKMQV